MPSKPIDMDTKRRIADLYQNTKMSTSAIAHFLEVSVYTVNKYKKIKWPKQTRIV